MPQRPFIMRLVTLMPKSKDNPYCSTPGCKTKAPHTDDLMVQHLLMLTTHPAFLAAMALVGMKQLKESVSRDVAAKCTYGWLTRIRQIEELYVRSLYLLFVATDEELPHFLSETVPNGFTAIYRKVNEQLFRGAGKLEEKHDGRDYPGQFSVMNLINQGAHCSFQSLMTAKGIEQKPERVNVQGYLDRITTYQNHLTTIIDLFNKGKNKAEVAAIIRSLYGGAGSPPTA